MASPPGTGAAAASYLPSLFVFIGAATILVNAEGLGAAAGIPLLGAGAAMGLAVGRMVFLATGRLLDRRLERLRAKLQGYLER